MLKSFVNGSPRQMRILNSPSQFRRGKPFFAQICFHFQQAAEKYLKSYIIANELEFLKIHDLPLLLKICKSKDPFFEQLREDCEFLTTFYVDTRYPVHWPTQFSPNETMKASQAAARIRDLVKNKLSSL
jgi:HEPN domain-containing protein